MKRANMQPIVCYLPYILGRGWKSGRGIFQVLLQVAVVKWKSTKESVIRSIGISSLEFLENTTWRTPIPIESVRWICTRSHHHHPSRQLPCQRWRAQLLERPLPCQRCSPQHPQRRLEFQWLVQFLWQPDSNDLDQHDERPATLREERNRRWGDVHVSLL